jgi:hypothetical protein
MVSITLTSRVSSLVKTSVIPVKITALYRALGCLSVSVTASDFANNQGNTTRQGYIEGKLGRKHKSAAVQSAEASPAARGSSVKLKLTAAQADENGAAGAVLSHVHSAVYVEHMPGDVTRFLARQERDSKGNIGVRPGTS